MISINDIVIPLSDYTIKRKYDGMDTLEFTISELNPFFEKMVTRQQIRCDNRLWRISIINAGGRGNANIAAELDLDEWKTELVASVNTGYITADEHMAMIKPTGWTVVGCETESQAVVNLGWATRLDIASAVQETYGVALHFDTLRKVVTLIDPESYEAENKYVISGLNAVKIAVNEKTSTFYTRMYPFGKDGIGITSVNPTGKPYIDDHTYSDATIAYIWENKNYTDETELYNAAIEELHRVSNPEIEYSIDIYDLAKMSAEYDWLSIGLLDVVSIKDGRRHRSVDMQVTEYHEHPLNPAKNKIKLSTRLKTTDGIVKNLQKQISRGSSSGSGSGSAYRVYQVERINDTQVIISVVNISNTSDVIHNVWSILEDEDFTKYTNLTTGEEIKFIGWEADT